MSEQEEDRERCEGAQALRKREELADNQETLGEEEQKILHDNLWDLYL